MRFQPSLTQLARALSVAALLAVAAPAARAEDTTPPPSFDNTNWDSVTNPVYPPPGTETYIRSFKEVVDGVLVKDVIESYWTDSNGTLHVDIVTNGALSGSYTYDPLPPSGDDGGGDPGGGGEDPTGGGGGGGPDGGITGNVPEPETWALAVAGLGIVGLRGIKKVRRSR
jgi:hypothetical protein